MEAAKQKAVVFDIDGTLAHMEGRIDRWGKKVAPFQDKDAYDDSVDEVVSKFLEMIDNTGDFSIIICSGRKDSSREILEAWLETNSLSYDELFMRKADDNRPDYVIKKEIYINNIFPKYDVFVVFDDRDQVVKMLRNDLGLKCFQVQEGSF